MFTPFALELHRRHIAGESVERLSSELGIPVKRIEQRLKAAAAYVASQSAGLSAAASSGTARALAASAGSGSEVGSGPGIGRISTFVSGPAVRRAARATFTQFRTGPGSDA